MSPRLLLNSRRKAAPAIVPYLFEAFDRCDPTRSREAKPSERERQRHELRRKVRTFVVSAALVATFAALIVHFAP